MRSDYSSDVAGGMRHVPVSLPRVRWLESDPECPYEPATDTPEVKKSSLPIVPDGVIIKKRTRRNPRPSVPAARWTEAEDKILWEIKDTKTPEEMALKLGRSRKSILQRLRLVKANKKIAEEKNRKRSV